MPKKNALLASTIAPCAPAILLNIAGLASSSFATSYLITGFALVFGYAGFLILGLPALMVLSRMGILNLATALVSGAVLGVLVFYLFWLTLGVVLESSAPFDSLAYLWGAALGFAVALCYGLLARLPLRSKVGAA